jgi:hypothetical protein
VCHILSTAIAGISLTEKTMSKTTQVFHSIHAPENLAYSREREVFIDNLLVRIHSIMEMIWWTGLAPWEFEFPLPGSLIFTFL